MLTVSSSKTPSSFEALLPLAKIPEHFTFSGEIRGRESFRNLWRHQDGRWGV